LQTERQVSTDLTHLSYIQDKPFISPEAQLHQVSEKKPKAKAKIKAAATAKTKAAAKAKTKAAATAKPKAAPTAKPKAAATAKPKDADLALAKQKTADALAKTTLALELAEQAEIAISQSGGASGSSEAGLTIPKFDTCFLVPYSKNGGKTMGLKLKPAAKERLGGTKTQDCRFASSSSVSDPC